MRVPSDLEGLDALVIPGGESTTMTLGVEREGLAEPLRAFAAAGNPVLGTCAGLIMLDRDHLGVMDMRAERNAFGRQIHSFEADVQLDGVEGGPMRGIFIRAPWISTTGLVSRSWGMSTAERSRRGRGRSWRSHFTPSWGRTTACTDCSWSSWRPDRRRDEGLTG